MFREICQNEGANYLKVEVVPYSNKGRVVKMCFPTGKEGLGWNNVAGSLKGFSGIQMAQSESDRGYESPGRKSSAEVVKEGSQFYGNSTIEVVRGASG